MSAVTVSSNNIVTISAGGAVGTDTGNTEYRVAIWIEFPNPAAPNYPDSASAIDDPEEWALIPRTSRTVLLNKKDALKLAMKIIEEAAR